MAEDQFIVLACDGIWDVMSNDAVIERITGYMSVEGESDPLLLAEELIEDALAKNSRDNMTACVVLFPASEALVSINAGASLESFTYCLSCVSQLHLSTGGER
jgi:serine/threonine protein phosphatase PrpC